MPTNLRLKVQRLPARLPKTMSRAEKELLVKVAQRSVSDLNGGGAKRAAQGAKIWVAALRNNGDGTSPFESCGDKCQHHLDNGDAAAYGVCYWACVARGGLGPAAAGVAISMGLKAKAAKFVR
jgi:hypothetical protein